MTRCIQCTRCVRFSTEVAGVTDLGLIGRGEDVEITSYLEAAMTSELQGNIIDLCPVGALTSKPYEFKARPWELTKTESIDIMDAVGSAIRVDSRANEVMRVLPRLNENVNEEWLSDKGRFIFDGLKTQRLDRPYLRVNGRLTPVSWNEAFAAISDKVKAVSPQKIGALAGQLASVEDMFAMKALMNALGSQNTDARYPNSPLHPRNGRASYLFNSGIAGIEDADAILIVGSNPRTEAPVLNARIRKRFLKGQVAIGVVGEKANLTYPYTYCGAGPESISDAAKTIFAEKKKPMLIIGQGALNRADGAAIYAELAKLAGAHGVITAEWNGFNILHTEASLVGALDIGFVPGAGHYDTASMLMKNMVDVLFLLGVDDIDVPAGPFVIYQGTHGDRGAHRADVILPGATFTEKSGLYVNTEGRVQLANRAIFPPGEAREDWAIIRALSGALGKSLPFDSLTALRKALYAEHPHFVEIGSVAKSNADAIADLAILGGTVTKDVFKSNVTDHYLTNAIARASKTMAECSSLARGRHVLAAE